MQVIRGGQTLTAANGMSVDVGDRIKTGPGSGATITLSDGSTLELGESGELTLDQHTINPNGAATTQSSLFSGVVRSVVAHLASGPVGNFEVHTPNAVASARGTVYDVDYIQGVGRDQYKDCFQFSDVSVFEGTVQVTNPSNPNGSVDVAAGHKAVVPCGLVPVVIGAAVIGGISGTTAAAAGGVAGVGGVVGGLAGAGAFGGGGSKHSATPMQ